jgi:hypothetical protein
MKKKEINDLNLDGWPIPNDFLIELGRISALWTSLEWMLETYIAKLSGFNNEGDPRPFILLRHTTFPQKLDMFTALCEKLKPRFQNLDGFEAVISDIRIAQKIRNRFIHNSVGFDPKTKKATLSVGTARGSVKASVETIDVVDIKKASIDINKAMISLHHLITGKKYPSIIETKKDKTK